MAPKVRFTKDEIISKGLDIVREGGISSLTARELSKRLNSSPKPIFCHFSGMEEVQNEIIKKATELYNSYISEDMKKGKYPPYKASGMAYIRFASEEKELFKLLFMRDRTKEEIGENREEIRPILDIIMKNLGLNEDEAYLFHLELWVYVHGIATMIATSYLNWDTNFVSKSLTDAYQGLKHSFWGEK